MKTSLPPEWMMDNPYITEGYREPGSYKGFFRELFSWHNETLNAWTMLLSGGIAVWLWLCYAPILISFIALVVSAIVPQITSINYHLKAHESEEVRAYHRHLDITFIGVASCFLALAYSTCIFHPLITSVLVGACAWVTYDFWSNCEAPSSSTCKKKTLRAVALFVGFYVLPFAVATLYYPSMVGIHFIGLLASLGLGAWVYVEHFPEKYIQLNYIGNSHQTMHLCLAVAHLCGFRYLQAVYKAE
jgi:hypothetical protein